MFRTLMLVVCVVRAEVWDSDETKNSPKGWLENLKRRLMTDNYDYQPSSNEIALRAVDKTEAPATTTTSPPSLDTQNHLDREMQSVYEEKEKESIDDDNSTFDLATMRNHYMTHADVDLTPAVPRNSIEKEDVEHGISRNDLQVYMSDSKRQVLEPSPDAKKNVSYKVIQPSLLSRRAGGAAPRFVEEVGADGVSLLSVDGAPFPEFQLPSARRQYQAVKDSFSEDWID